MKSMERAGHADIETTMRYVRLAESIGEGFLVHGPCLACHAWWFGAAFSRSSRVDT